MAMFKLIRDKSKTSLLAYDWIDVLAVLPSALSPDPAPKPHPDGSRAIESVAWCLTPEGVAELRADALWEAMHEEEYVVRLRGCRVALGEKVHELVTGFLKEVGIDVATDSLAEDLYAEMYDDVTDLIDDAVAEARRDAADDNGILSAESFL